MINAFQITVFGKVQGVWFRKGTQIQAQKLGLNGHVQNKQDGSVLIHAYGEEAQLKKLQEWCKDGTPHAKVERIEVTEIPFKNLQEFSIIR